MYAPYIVRLSRVRYCVCHQTALQHPNREEDPWDFSIDLTERQGEVYKFIREKIRGRGYGPTVREIATQFGISSPNGVVCHLKALEKKGLITREPNMSRAIQLAAEPIEERGLPLAGSIAAGVLHEAIEQNERVDFQEMFNPGTKSLFVLQVHGDSMIEDQIADGDYVVVQKQRTARKGQIVVAMTGRGRSHAETLVPREEPHPPGAGQPHDEADLRQGRPRAGRGGRRGAEGEVRPAMSEGRSTENGDSGPSSQPTDAAPRPAGTRQPLGLPGGSVPRC